MLTRMVQAAEDIKRGITDTSNGAETDKAYQKQTETDVVKRTFVGPNNSWCALGGTGKGAESTRRIRIFGEGLKTSATLPTAFRI
jgi:hypothetical protein